MPAPVPAQPAAETAAPTADPPPARAAHLPSARACARACQALLTTGPYRVWAHALFAAATSVYLVTEAVLHVAPVPALEHARAVSPLFAEHLATCRDVRADARVPRAALWRDLAAGFADAPVPFSLLFHETCRKIGLGEIMPQYFDGMRERDRRALWEACLRVALVLHAVHLCALVVVCYATVRRVLSVPGNVVLAPVLAGTPRDDCSDASRACRQSTAASPDLGFVGHVDTSETHAMPKQKNAMPKTKDTKSAPASNLHIAWQPGHVPTEHDSARGHHWKHHKTNTMLQTDDHCSIDTKSALASNLHIAWEAEQDATPESAALQHAAVWFACVVCAGFLAPAAALLASQPVRAAAALVVLVGFGAGTVPVLLHGDPGFGWVASAGDAAAAALWVALALATGQVLVAPVGMLAMGGLVALRACAWPVAQRLVPQKSVREHDEVFEAWGAKRLEGGEHALIVHGDCCGVTREQCGRAWLAVGAVVWGGDSHWFRAE